MSNPRTLNYPLGAIGNELLRLSEVWNEEVPPIQALVINKSSGLPGKGIAFFAPEAAQFRTASLNRKRAIVDRLLGKIYAFRRWDEVLSHFGLDPVVPSLPTADRNRRDSRRTAEESPEHKALKRFIADHPGTVGAPASAAPGTTEFLFPSQDRVDVLFRGNREWLAVEVKSERSDLSDLERGLFQCIKYRALLRALLRVAQRPLNARVVLAVAHPLPRELLGLKHLLGVDVVTVNPAETPSE